MRSARVMTFRVLMAPARTFRLLSRVMSIITLDRVTRIYSARKSRIAVQRAEKLIGRSISFQAKIWLYFDRFRMIWHSPRILPGEISLA